MLENFIAKFETDKETYEYPIPIKATNKGYAFASIKKVLNKCQWIKIYDNYSELRKIRSSSIIAVHIISQSKKRQKEDIE